MTHQELLSEVFACMHCDRSGLPFVRNGDGKFYRFPPTIGAVGPAPLLFIGINPRVSETNQPLHDDMVQDRTSFAELARNRVRGVAYIARQGLENHYLIHVRVAESLFPDSAFESVAVVTELHFCASRSSTGLPRDSSKCADRFLGAVLRLVSPKIIFAVGRPVERTLARKFRDTLRGRNLVKWVGGKAPVIPLLHPNTYGEKETSWQSAIAEARNYLAQCSSEKNQA